MLAEREIGVRFPSQNGLRVGKFAEPPFAVIRAHTGVSGSVEWYALDHHVDADLIDATAAVLLRPHHTVCPFLVFCK